MADNKRRGRPGSGRDDDSQSIFDLFEPPPEPDAGSFGRIPIIREEEQEDEESLDLTDSSMVEAAAAAEVEAAGLAHWTEPATGQVPAALASEGTDGTKELEGPSWRNDESGGWSGADLADVFAETEAVTTPARASVRTDSPPPPAALTPPAERATERSADRAPARTPAGPSLFDRPPAGPTTTERAPAAQPAPTADVPPPARRERPAADGRAAAARTTAPAPGPTRGPRPGGSGRDGTDAEAPSRIPAPIRARDDVGRMAEPVARGDVPPPVASAPTRERVEPGARPGGERRLQGIDLGLSGSPANGGPTLAPDVDPRLTPGPPVRRRALADGPSPDRGVLDAGTRPASQSSIPPAMAPAPLAGFDDDPHAPDEDGYGDYEDYADDEGGAGGGFLSRLLAGVAMVALVFVALGIGPEVTLVLVAVLALVGVMELFNAMRTAGLRPATLLGLVGAVALPVSTYIRGEAAYPLVVGLAVVFGMLWYLTGADTERPVLNLGLTMTGILWVGGLAGFAALILREDGGIQLLLATILITATSDTLAYLGGRAYGARPFHEASPNKTWEGTLTGFFGAVFAGLVIGVTGVIGLFDEAFITVMVLAVVIGVLAPIGDLAESLVKRDLGIKDMGTIIPGHGGVLDRVDGLLFALPGAYYVAVVQQLFVS